MATAVNQAIAHAQDYAKDVVPTQAEREAYVEERVELYDAANVLDNKLAHGKTSIAFPGY